MMANVTVRLRRRMVRVLQSSMLPRRLGFAAGGFALAAASLRGRCQPLAMAWVCGLGGWDALAAALGAALGYRLLWGGAGRNAAVWLAAGLGISLLPRRRWAVPAALTGLAVGLTALLRDPSPGAVLDAGVAAASAAIFIQCRAHPGTVADWGAQALWVLALARVEVGVNFGAVAAGFLAASGAFPAAVLAGAALDLAQLAPMSMAGALALGFCLRWLRWPGRWACCTPVLGYGLMAALGGGFRLSVLPGLALGGGLAALLPGSAVMPRAVHRRGETAVAQVRLEQMALVLGQLEQLLLTEATEPDRGSVLTRAVATACDTCPERRQCRGRQRLAGLDAAILEQPGLSAADLPPGCRKQGRLLLELRRGQEQLRRMKAQRSQTAACREAVREQYRFLAEFLRGISDDLQQRRRYRPARFQPDIACHTRSLHRDNGDQCCWFTGTRGRYYVALCDGMGTGTEAMVQSRQALGLLRQSLSVGYPAEYALRSLNSLAVLGELGGSVTVDLLELSLDSGKAALYKWGAAPSYLLRRGKWQKIGTAGPPPGLSRQARESVERLSLGGGEVLILLSDGAMEEGRSHWEELDGALSPGELAAAVLELGAQGGDDATAVAVRLRGLRASTQ